jgi:hypothetical protein
VDFLGNYSENKPMNMILEKLQIQAGLKLIQGNTFNTAINMEHLNLSNNKIAFLDEKAFSGLKNLEKLELYENKIKNLPTHLFHELPELKELDLGDNRLKTFDFVCLEKNVRLLVLDLQSNSIAHIQTSQPVTKLNLEDVIISHNWLKVLSFDHFPDLPFLETFKVDGNRLTEIEYNGFKSTFPSLTLLYFKENHWECCYLHEMVQDFRKKLSKITIDKIFCDDLNHTDFIKRSRCQKNLNGTCGDGDHSKKNEFPKNDKKLFLDLLKVLLAVGLFILLVLLVVYLIFGTSEVKIDFKSRCCSK